MIPIQSAHNDKRKTWSLQHLGFKDDSLMVKNIKVAGDDPNGGRLIDGVLWSLYQQQSVDKVSIMDLDM
jgi:hypothetical protein